MDDAPRGTAGTDQQDPLAGQGQAGVVLDIPHQALAVGVVAQQAAVVQTLDGIYRAGPFRRGRAIVGQSPGLLLERNGHVDTQPLAQEAMQGTGEIIQRRQQRFVLQLFTGLPGEQAMDQR